MKRISVILTAMLISLVMGGSWSWAAEQECSTETTGWVLESPGEDWTQVDQRTVIDKEAWTETISEAVPEIWANWSPNNTNGPQDYVPVWPEDERGTWQVHDKIPGGHAGEDGVYQRDNPGQGNSDWFYRQNGKDAVTVDHEAVTHEEYKFEKTTCVDKPDEPKPTPTPEPTNHDSPDEPKADKPGSPQKPVKELPHTGGNLALAGIAAALLATGTGMVLFGRRRLTDV